MSRLVPAAALVLTMIAGVARADEPVTTAGAAEAPKAPAGDTTAQIEDFIRHAPPPNRDDGTPDGVVPPEPRKVHGEVGVAVGSGGYRSGYAVSVMPVGQTGTLALAVSETRFGKMGGGYPGGRDGFAPGRRQSVGMSLSLGEAARDGCRGRARGFEPYGLERADCREPDADR